MKHTNISNISNKVLKMNLIHVVEHHKKYCEGVDCNISLFFLRLMAEKSGIKFTQKEKSMFI